MSINSDLVISVPYAPAIADREEIWTRICLMAMNLMTAVKIKRKLEAKAAA